MVDQPTTMEPVRFQDGRRPTRRPSTATFAVLPPRTLPQWLPEANITVVDPHSPEGKAWAEKLKREIEAGKARVRKHGGTSFDGFYIDEDGRARSLREDD